jgi:porin
MDTPAGQAAAAGQTAGAVADQPLTPASDWPTLTSLLKLPDWLQLGLNIQSDGLGNPGGGTSRKGNWIQQTTLDGLVSTGFGKPVGQWKEADHWNAHLQLTHFSGASGYGQSIGTAFPITATDHPIGLWLTEATIERRGGNGSVDVKAGVFSLNPGFVDAPVLNAYVNAEFNNTLNLNVLGLPINPFIAPGLEVHWRPGTAGRGASAGLGPYGEWRYGAFVLNPQIKLASLFGVNPNQASINGYLQAVQWSFDRLPGSKALEQPIRRNGQWISRVLPKPLLQLGAGYLQDQSDQVSYPGLFGTLTFAAPTPLGLDNRFWIGVSDGMNSSTNPDPVFVSGGWLSQGVIPGRPLDVLALGVGRSTFNPQISSDLTPESVLELNYSAAINSTLTLQPFLNWVLNPGGGRNIGNVLALGLQVQLQF